METFFFNLMKPRGAYKIALRSFPAAVNIWYFQHHNFSYWYANPRTCYERKKWTTVSSRPGTKVINRRTYALNYCLRRYTAQQQQQQRGSRGFPGQHGSRGFRTGAPNWSFIFDPAGRLCYYWSMVVSLAFLYNFWVIIYRFAFQEING